MQVPAPAAGVIEALLVPDGGKVEGGTPLFKLRKTGGKSGMCITCIGLCISTIFFLKREAKYLERSQERLNNSPICLSNWKKILVLSIRKA